MIFLKIFFKIWNIKNKSLMDRFNRNGYKEGRRKVRLLSFEKFICWVYFLTAILLKLKSTKDIVLFQK